MKNTSVCTKCGSKAVVKIPGTQQGQGFGNNIKMSWWGSQIVVTRYLCTDCGFSEEWADSADDLKKIREKYGQPS